MRLRPDVEPAFYSCIIQCLVLTFPGTRTIMLHISYEIVESQLSLGGGCAVFFLEANGLCR